jgi:hypothetical protein
MTGCRRCLVARNGVATVREIREWAYVGRPQRHWQYAEIRRALRQLGAKQLGRSGGRGRPGIWAIR